MNIYKPQFRFYVYAYLRKNGTPYYIGKGEGSRAWSLNHTIKPPKDKQRIVLLETNLSDIGALAIERRLIRWYGRLELGTGLLRNKTDGGDGCAGRVTSPETVRKALETKRKTGGIKAAGSKEARNKATITRLKNNNGKYSTQTAESIKKGIETKIKNHSLNNAGGWNKTLWKLQSPSGEIITVNTKGVSDLKISLFILKSNLGNVVKQHPNHRSIISKNTVGWMLIDKIVVGRTIYSITNRTSCL